MINDDRKEHKTTKKDSDWIEIHGKLIRLFEVSTQVIPKSSANRYSQVYLSIWIDLALLHEECKEYIYMARDVFKLLKNNRIGTTFPLFW